MYWELAHLFEGMAEFWVERAGEDAKLVGTYDLDSHRDYDKALDRFHDAFVKHVEAREDTLMIFVEV